MMDEWRDRVLAFFQRRRTNFRLGFGSPAGRQILADLHEFCHASQTTARLSDRDAAYGMAIREGRRQVWLRIERAIDLTPEEQLAIIAEKDKP